MRYKPLLLALLIAFTAPAFAAKEAPKEKAAAKKAAIARKDKQAPADEAEKTPKAAAKKPKNSRADSSKAETERGQKRDDNKKAPEPRKASKAAKADDGDDAKEEKKRAKSGVRPSEKEKKPAAPNRPSENADERRAAAKSDARNKKSKIKAEKDEQDAPSKSEYRASGKKAAADDKNTRSGKRKGDEDKTSQAAKPTEKSSDSPELRDALSAASNDLEAKQALQKRTANFLIRVNGSLKDLQQTRSNLSNINRQQRDAWEKLQKLDTELSALKTEVANTRAQISRFVSGNYKNSQPNAVALFLKKAEPGQKTRFLRYTRYINGANEQVIKDLGRQQKELAAQERKINAELGRLKKLQANAHAALNKQGVHNTAEQVESRRQSAQMAKEAKKAVSQKDNEQRLNNLLSDLDKQKAEARKKEAEARKKAAEARLAAAEKERQNKAAEQKQAAERASLSNLTDEDLKLQAPQSALFTSAGKANDFSRMQGRLKKPVNGMLSGLFGHQRDNGEVWKGVFYSTAPAPVSSIAAGNVVYAAPLEGYGNVVVIDHGDQYVSIYSGLSETAVAKGYSVGAGNTIGTSGALPGGEEGLYLEIRYNGQNMNPLSWIN